MAVDTSSSLTGGAVTYMMSKDFSVSGGQLAGVAGIINAYGAAEAQKAAAINQQTSYLLQARDTLAIAQIRAEMSKNMRATNAAMRARAAASGVVLGEGSVQAVQRENVAATMRDVGIADLNALTARVMGFEDATAMLQSTDIQNMLSLYSARGQAAQGEFAGAAVRKAGGILAGATLSQGVTQGYKIITDT